MEDIAPQQRVAARSPFSPESDVARNPPSFTVLDKAFWDYVAQECPHPVHSRQRYAWVRANLTFEYHGITYVRSTVTVAPGYGTDGRQVTVVIYEGHDGSQIQNRELPQSLYGT